MFQRVLAVNISQVIRSIFLVLLPIAFMALIAWATAGSASGDTTDPVRAAIWIYLGAHHIPFSVSLSSGAAGYFSYLPIGALVLPVFAIRSSFNRGLSKLHGDFHFINQVRLTFSIIYTIIITIFSFLSGTSEVRSTWYFAPLFAFAISYFTTLTCGVRRKISQALLISTRALALLMGTSTIALSILIFVNLPEMRRVTTILEPGIFGGTLLFLLSLFYLPNFAVAAMSYFSGAGFAIGTGTLISPLTRTIGDIPAFPLLATTPTTSSKWTLLAIVLFIATGASIAVIAGTQKTLMQSFTITTLCLLLLTYLASGSLVTDSMGAVGVSIWKTTLIIVIELALGAALVIFTPLIWSRRR